MTNRNNNTSPLSTNDHESAKSLEDLGGTIQYCDSISQEANRQIASIARLALKSLENMQHPRCLLDVADALETIYAISGQLMDDISISAERAGWNSVDASMGLRMRAILDASKKAFQAKDGGEVEV